MDFSDLYVEGRWEFVMLNDSFLTDIVDNTENDNPDNEEQVTKNYYLLLINLFSNDNLIYLFQIILNY